MSAVMTETRERPILFSGPMVRALLDGSKTQTRRVVKPQPELQKMSTHDGPPYDEPHWCMYPDSPDDAKRACWPEGAAPYWTHCPYGQPGDRLWVRETIGFDENGHSRYAADGAPLLWSGDAHRVIDWVVAQVAKGKTLVPSIHMPRWASRLTLEITGVRVERVRDISEADAKAEGCESEAWPEDVTADDGALNGECGYFPPRSYAAGYARLWDSLNAARGYGWDVNPWVWVIEFATAPAAPGRARRA